MSDEITRKRITGYVFPAGNGAVGKSSLAQSLRIHEKPEYLSDSINKIRKSKNLEFEFITDQYEEGEQTYTVVQQFLIPPGQRSFEGNTDGRSYENIIDIYKDFIRRVDVVLLSYNITSLDSFHDLEGWAKQTCNLIHPFSAFILVGTHLDQTHVREVTTEQLKQGIHFIHKLIRSERSDWQGISTGLEVSNMNGQNLNKLKRFVSQGILHAAKIKAVEHVCA